MPIEYKGMKIYPKPSTKKDKNGNRKRFVAGEIYGFSKGSRVWVPQRATQKQMLEDARNIIDERLNTRDVLGEWLSAKLV